MSATVHRFEQRPPLPSSPRSIAIAAHFGILATTVPATRSRRLSEKLDRAAAAKLGREPRPPQVRCPIELPRPGQLLLLCGASGSGKSSLLRAMRHEAHGRRIIDLRRIVLREQPIVDLFDPTPAGATGSKHEFGPILRRLARVGLAEVWTWLRPPSQLSEGQRWRLRLALAMHAVDSDSDRRPTLIVCDEFAALLDRVTAFVVAGVLRRFVDTHAARVSAIVATSHDDLRKPLDPDAIAECDFGQVSVRQRHRCPTAR